MKLTPKPALWAAALCTLGLSACSSTMDKSGDTHFSRPPVYYNLKADQAGPATPDQMLRFEPKHYMHGAISQEDQRQREGKYITFWWRTKDTSAPTELKFEYRHEGTGSTVHVENIPIDNLKRKNTTKVQVTGEAYHTLGKVTAWKASIIQNGASVASTESYLWN